MYGITADCFYFDFMQYSVTEMDINFINGLTAYHSKHRDRENSIVFRNENAILPEIMYDAIMWKHGRLKKASKDLFVKRGLKKILFEEILLAFH